MDHHPKRGHLPFPSHEAPAPAASDPPHLHAHASSLVSVTTRAGVLALRDAGAGDLDAYLRYWHYSGERIKDLLGIDRRKLGNPAQSRARFLSMLRKPGTYPSDVIFTATLNSHVIGYTNMNRYGSDESYVHLHLYPRALRSVLLATSRLEAARAGAGLAAALIGPGLAMYFRLFPLRRLILQTRPENSAINKALDWYEFPLERRYVENPAGLAAPGQHCLRYVYREDVPRMLRCGEQLSRAGAAAAMQVAEPVRSDHGLEPRPEKLQ